MLRRIPDPAGYQTGVWVPYSPAIIQNSVVAATVTQARWCLIGKTMHCIVDLTASAVGTATVKILVSGPSANDSPAGSVPVFQASAAGVHGFGQFALGGTVYRALLIFDQINGVTPFFSLLRTDNTVNGGIGAVAPTAAIAVSDRFLYHAIYEVN